eukprot:519514-Amphidinium_carterae.1
MATKERLPPDPPKAQVGRAQPKVIHNNKAASSTPSQHHIPSKQPPMLGFSCFVKACEIFRREPEYDNEVLKLEQAYGFATT